MNYKMMGRFLAQILFLEGVMMLPALGISLYCGADPAVRGFLIAIAVARQMPGAAPVGTAGTSWNMPREIHFRVLYQRH